MNTRVDTEACPWCDQPYRRPLIPDVLIWLLGFVTAVLLMLLIGNFS